MHKDQIIISNDASDVIDTASESFWGLLVNLATQRAKAAGSKVVSKADVEAILEDAFKVVRKNASGVQGKADENAHCHAAG